MSESDKSSSNMPAVLVVILAMLGLASFPLGGGKLSDSSPKSQENTGPAGATRDSPDDENHLGPLAAIKADQVPDPPAGPPRSPETGPRAENEDPGKVERDKILKSEHDLRFLIALVPDPDSASMSHEFDLTLGAVQRGVESAKFVAVRWSGMPGFPSTKGPPPLALKPAVPHLKGKAGKEVIDLTIEEKPAARDSAWWPASVLCRASYLADKKARKTLLLILLVPESPTQGVDKARLGKAMEIAISYKNIHKCCKHTPAEAPWVCIVGPNFSGSVRSMISVLKPYTEKYVKPGPLVITVYNGRAMAPDLALFEELGEGSIRFRSTTYSNAELNSAVRTFVKKITPSWAKPPRFAILNESNTQFGQQAPGKEHQRDTDYFGFPLNIAQIWEAYRKKGYLGTKELLKLQSPDRLSPLEMAGPRGDRDLIPVVTPAESAVGGEMNLSQLLMALERGHYTWVGINATNPYDRLFLAEKVRVACPDARLFFVNASALYFHHTTVPYLRGTLVASAYPLDPDTQTWTASPGSFKGDKITRLAFGNYYEEGIYNATVAHLADMGLDDTPGFLDYAYPGRDLKNGAESVPSVWIGVVGQRQVYPLSLEHPEPDSLKSPNEKFSMVGGIYRYDAARGFPEGDGEEVLDAQWIGLLLTAAIASVVVSLWYLRTSLTFQTGSTRRWPWWGDVCPGLREAVDHPSARKLAAAGASAGFGLMVFLSAPVWVMVTKGELIPVTPFLGALLTGLAFFACLGLGVAAVVALYRMLVAGGNEPLGLGETLYRATVTVGTLLQIVLPVYVLVSLELNTDAAGLRLFCARVTRLVNGVTPMVPVLLLGLTGGIVMLGDWRRVKLRIRMNATGSADALGSGPLAEVWERFQSARRVLDRPYLGWGGAGVLATLPLWVALSLVGITVSHRLPIALEPYSLFLLTFLLTFGANLGLLVVRMVDLFGLSRVLDLLLRRLAEVPLARAFDRVPSHFAHENFWRPNSLSKIAAEDSDPRLDRQFEAVVAGYESVKKDARFMPVQARGLDDLIGRFSPSGKLSTRDWWPAVGALAPFLAPHWSARTAIPSAPPDDTGEWVGLPDDKLKRWLVSAEDLIAMVMVRQIAWLHAAVNSILSFLVVGLVMMPLVLTSYPFEPQGPLFALIGALTVIAVGSIVVIAVQASRDEVLSRLNKTVTDRFTFDRQFFTTVVTYVVPLLGLLGALSYSLSDLFRSLLEPFFRAG